MLEGELQKELLGRPVPVSPELLGVLIDLPTGDLEGDSLVWFGGKEEVLPLLVRWLHLLFIGGHESMTRHDALHDLRQVNLIEQTLLSHLWITLLGHLVSRASNLDKLLDIHPGFLRRRLGGRILSLLGSSPRQVCLMLLALSVSQVASLIVMKSQTELALI